MDEEGNIQWSRFVSGGKVSDGSGIDEVSKGVKDGSGVDRDMRIGTLSLRDSEGLS